MTTTRSSAPPGPTEQIPLAAPGSTTGTAIPAVRAAVALAGVHVLVAVGEMVWAVVLASALVAVGVLLAATSADAALRRAGSAVAAVSLLVIASITAPGLDPVARVAIAAFVVSPFVVAEPDGGYRAWWARPTKLPSSLAVAIGLGCCFGAVLATVPPAVDLSGRAGWAMAAGLIGVGVAAAVEEVVYRGLLLDGLGGGPVAVLGAAAIGGIAALGSGEALTVALAVLMGIAWGELRRRTGSLVLPVTAHVVTALSLQLWWGWT